MFKMFKKQIVRYFLTYSWTGYTAFLFQLTIKKCTGTICKSIKVVFHFKCDQKAEE